MGPAADQTTRVIDLHDAEDDTEEIIEVKRAQIEETRAEMTGTIDAIKDKLDPQMLMDKAKSTVHDVTEDVKSQVKETVDHAAHTFSDATVGRAQEALGAAGEKVGDVMHTAQEYGSNAANFVQRNAVPLALIGVGLGWLYSSMQKAERDRRWGRDYYSVYERDRFTDYPSAPGYPAPHHTGYHEGAGVTDQVREKAHEVKDQVQQKAGEMAGRVQGKAHEVADRVQGKASEVTERVQQRTGEVVHRAQERAGQAADSFQQMLHDNPLAVGAVALGIGAAIGLLIPETRQENRLMGGAKDQLMERAQDTAQDMMHKAQAVAERAIDTAKETARETGQAVKEEARNQGLTPESQGLTPGSPGPTPGSQGLTSGSQGRQS